MPSRLAARKTISFTSRGAASASTQIFTLHDSPPRRLRQRRHGVCADRVGGGASSGHRISAESVVCQHPADGAVAVELHAFGTDEALDALMVEYHAVGAGVGAKEHEAQIRIPF